MKTNYYLGIDIGGTKCSVVAGTAGMEILERVQFATETQKGLDFTIANLLRTSSDLFHKLQDHNLVSIGICCGGPLNSKTGVIQSPPNLPGWDNVEIVRIFRQKFNVPVLLQNDANACALAEWRFGAGKGTRNMVFLTFGTGMGAGLILDGRLYAGTNDLAGEIGHIRLSEDGPEAYGKKGSFEGFCSGTGIARLAHEMIRDKFKDGEEVSFCKDESQVINITTRDVADAAANGDKLALEIFGISGRYLGIGLSILIDILNPECIVIGSVYARNPQLFQQECIRMIETEALRPAHEVCRIVPAALGDEVGDFASLSVAMEFEAPEERIS